MRLFFIYMATARSKALKGEKKFYEKEGGKHCNYCGGGHQSKEHYLTTSPYNRGEGKSGMRKGKGGIMEY